MDILFNHWCLYRKVLQNVHKHEKEEYFAKVEENMNGIIVTQNGNIRKKIYLDKAVSE